MSANKSRKSAECPYCEESVDVTNTPDGEMIRCPHCCEMIGVFRNETTDTVWCEMVGDTDE